ncbi:caspase family protein [uncultured Aquimarina sp.]|uniref:caspase family protein n=1 Tax=uncultured Aquimarina sp. TaxID=575652 RepID=UPI00261FC0B5|nr:caspase family protein [uncultured Aquimarina sp.]
MKPNSLLVLLFSITFHLSHILCAQNQEILIAQKPASETSKTPQTLGINFNLSGDKSKLILVTDNQLEIWNTNSRRILLKKELGSEKNTRKFEINYNGNIYAILKSDPKVKKHHSIEFYRIQDDKPFLILDSKTDNLIDGITKIRFNKQGDKIAVIHRKHGIKFYQIGDGLFSILKHLTIPKNRFTNIRGFDFSNDDKHFFILAGNDLRHNSPITYQKWNLNSFELKEEVVSKDFGLNSSFLSEAYSNLGHKIASPGWNLEHGLFINCKYMQTLTKSKRVGTINPTDKSYLELYSATTKTTRNILSHKYNFNEAIVVDPQTVITSDERRNIQVWNIKTGQLIRSMKTDNIIKEDDFDMPILKKLSRINIMRVDPYKKEVYYSISSVREIHVWNYKYDTDEIFQSNMVSIASPFFTSDSTIVYKKGIYLEHFDFKNQKTISLKKENNENKTFHFKYNRTKNKGITKTDNSLKLWNIKSLSITDSIQFPDSSFDPYFISENLDYVALPVSQDLKNMFSSLQENPNKPIDNKKVLGDVMKSMINKTHRNQGDKVDSQNIKIKLYHIKNGAFEQISEINVPGFAIQKVSFIPKTNQMLICAFNLPISTQTANYNAFKNYIYDIHNKTLRSFPNEINGITKIIPATNTFLSLKPGKNNFYEAKIVDITTKKIINRFTFIQEGIQNNGKIDILDNDKALLYGKKNNYVLDLTAGSLTSLNKSFDDFDVSEDQKLLVTAHGSLSFYHNSFENKLYDKYYHIDNQSSITILPTNYYFNKGKGYELVSLLKNNKTYGFEQFDLKYHRPDLVIESIKETLGDSIYRMKELYELAYKKRLQRIGKKKEEELQSDLHAPELTIVNKSRIPSKTDNPIIDINIKVTDNKYNVKDLQISVNGVLIRKLNHDLKEKSYSKTIPLVLSNGENKILISAINDQGTSSDQEEIHVEYVGKPTPSHLYIVSLGVSEYQYLKNTPNSSKDAIKIVETFKQNNTTTVKSLGLVNKQVTKNNLKQISEFLLPAKENDVILFFVSGHAIQVENEYFFCTSTSKIDNITTTGITYDDFDNLLGNTRSRNRVFILNTCYSGEIFDVNNIKEIQAVGLMRKVFEDLKLTNGTTVISASEGTDKYYESTTKGNGLITLAILELITLKKEITVQEFCNGIIEYCKIKSDKDPFKSKTKKNTPLIRYDNIYNNFRLW